MKKAPPRPPDSYVEEAFEVAEEFGISDHNSNAELIGVGAIAERYNLSVEEAHGLAHAVEMAIATEQNEIYGTMLVETAIQNCN